MYSSGMPSGMGTLLEVVNTSDLGFPESTKNHVLRPPVAPSPRTYVAFVVSIDSCSSLTRSQTAPSSWSESLRALSSTRSR